MRNVGLKDTSPQSSRFVEVGECQGQTTPAKANSHHYKKQTNSKTLQKHTFTDQPINA